MLFELDPRPFQAALEQAQALLGRDRATAQNAEQEAKRYAALAEKEYVTAQQNDAVRTDRRGRVGHAGVEPGGGGPGAAQSPVRHDPGADRGAHRQPAASARATWCARPTRCRW